jgi:hypothetical protein
LGSQNFNNYFIVNRRSQVFTIAITSPPEASGALTLSISHPLLCFLPSSAASCLLGAPAPLTLSWGANDISKSFTFTPIALPPTGDWLQQLQIVVGGTDAQYYEYTQLWTALANIQILPNLAWSPIPVTYIDQDAVGMSVQLVDGLGGSWPYGAVNAFTLHMYSPAAGGISFEPSALTFSPSAPFSQSYVIHHVYPGVVDSAVGNIHPNSAHSTGAYSDSYPIGWSIKFVGTNVFIPITKSVVPQEVQRVVVARYQIMPSFPSVIANVWQPASFNLSRAPLAHLILVPHQPDRDGVNNMANRGTPTGLGGAGTIGLAAHYSTAVAAGKIVTEPPVIVFNAGQTVANFQVRAIGGNPSQLYYRLDWQLSGHKDDRVCYIESSDPSPQANGPYTFSTYHQAAAHVVSVAVAALCAVVVAVLM